MKKMVTLAAVLALSLMFHITAFAATPTSCPKDCVYAGAKCDGTCADRCSCSAYADADKDGICDNCGAACAYRDADGDGVCDHYTQSQRTRQNNTGKSSGKSHWRSHHGSRHHKSYQYGNES